MGTRLFLSLRVVSSLGRLGPECTRGPSITQFHLGNNKEMCAYRRSTPISPAHFLQLDLPIMASGEDTILIYEGIVQGHALCVPRYLDTNDRRDIRSAERAMQKMSTIIKLCAYSY